MLKSVRLSAFKLLATWQGIICLSCILMFGILAYKGEKESAMALLPIAGASGQSLGAAMRPRDQQHGDGT